MKRCPACQREYDDATTYCETDGTALEAGGPVPNNQSRMLADFIAQSAPLAVDRAVRVAMAICQAVEELERAGRSVNALYPRAIRIESHGQIDEIKLSKAPIEPIGGGQMQDEREAYLSPEAAQQQPTNAASAVYSIGTMLYEMLTGQPPFTVTTDAAIRVKHILEPPRPPTSLRPEIPLRVQEVTLRALEKDNQLRQRSPAQLQRELEATLVPAPPSQGLASITSSPQPSPQAPPAAPFAPPPAPYRPPSAPVQAPPSKREIKPAPSAAPMAERSLKTAIEPPPAAAAQPTAMVEASSIAASPPRLTCPNCGHRNNLDDKFCAVCGSMLAIASAAAQTMVLSSVAPPATARLRLIMASGEAGDIYQLSDETVIGRASGDLLFPHDNFLSGRHARIERRGDRFVLIDEDSRNGTFIKIKDEVQLQTDDRILIGKQLFRAEIESPEPAPANDDEDTPTIVRPKPLPPTPVDITPAPEPPVVDEPPSVAEEKQCPDCGRLYPLDHLYCEHDGQALQLPEPDAPLEEIGPFTIGHYLCFARLGEGGMGVVYKARHQHLDRLSAVKVLLPETAHLPEAVSRFRREAQIASSINHPNSVVIYDYGEVSERLFYLAMEFIAGKSLAQILKPKQQPLPLPMARTLSIARQICDVLDAAHQVGIIHRDLKPHNVMICERAGKPDLVKVVDFGLARSVSHRSDSLPGVVVGTPAFMSPEQARGELNIDARTDIFSLALMVYRMLSGELPFPAEGLDLWSQVMRRAKLVEPPPPLSFLRPELRIPAEVDGVLALALAPDRNERTPTAGLFIEQLEKAARR